MSKPTVIRRTFSVCPVCFKRVQACLVMRGGNVYLEKVCSEHGPFSAVTWRGEPALGSWVGELAELAEPKGECPKGCGLCPDHRQGTCCVLLEVTARCNLKCAHCFAESGPDDAAADPPLEQVQEWVSDIAKADEVFLQLSGGEPTIRDDLPQVVLHAKQAGCKYVQINSNGLRLAEDESYVKALAHAGLSFVFMQFDGTDDAIYQTLRGAVLLKKKLKAIELCGKYHLGVILVPTVVPGVNEHDIGNILRLAVAYAPVVRGVHFQPVSYFGRYPKAPSDAQRVTLPEIVQAVFAQASDIVPENSIAPSRCDHARCGFHGAYIALPDGLQAMTKHSESCCTPVSAENNRHFVGLRWQREPASQRCNSEQPVPASELMDLTSLDTFLQKARSHSFTISAMAFQDAYTLDLERLGQCSLHVYAHGAMVPFCAYYLDGAKTIQHRKRYFARGL